MHSGKDKTPSASNSWGKCVWNSLVVEREVGGDLAGLSPNTSSCFSPVQHRTLELGSAGESQHCPHPCQMMECSWIFLLLTLLLPSCGGLRLMSFPFGREQAATGQCHWVGGTILTTGQGDKTVSKRMLFLHKIDLPRKKEMTGLDPRTAKTRRLSNGGKALLWLFYKHQAGDVLVMGKASWLQHSACSERVLWDKGQQCQLSSALFPQFWRFGNTRIQAFIACMKMRNA